MFTTGFKHNMEEMWLGRRSLGRGSLFGLAFALAGFAPSANAGPGTLTGSFTLGSNTVDGSTGNDFQVTLNDELPIRIDFTPSGDTNEDFTFSASTVFTGSDDFLLTELHLRWEQENINTDNAPITIGTLGYDSGSPDSGATVSSFSSGVDFHEVTLDFIEGDGLLPGGSMDFDIFTWGGFNPNNNYSLTIDANEINPIPIPAAVWLFASALFGVGALSRRGAGSNRG